MTDPFWDNVKDDRLSPYISVPAEDWGRIGQGQKMVLGKSEVEGVVSLGDRISVEEVARIYLPLSRLLSIHVEAALQLYKQRQDYVQRRYPHTPFVIGIAGSVAVGKSTTARILQKLLSRWPSNPRVDLVTTDGFLLPNAQLEKQNILDRKGFPESYSSKRLLEFLEAVKSGKPQVSAPVYSHLYYDVDPSKEQVVDTPDVLIFEGLNVLQTSDKQQDGKPKPFVSDYFDLSIYVDADTDDIKNWYVQRFMALRKTAFTNPESYFHRYTQVTEEDALETANSLWSNINEINLYENILPTRPRADVVLRKGKTHFVDEIALRKL